MVETQRQHTRLLKPETQASTIRSSVSIHVDTALGSPPTGVGVTNFLSALLSCSVLLVVGWIGMRWV